MKNLALFFTFFTYCFGFACSSSTQQRGMPASQAKSQEECQDKDTCNDSDANGTEKDYGVQDEKEGLNSNSDKDDYLSGQLEGGQEGSENFEFSEDSQINTEINQLEFIPEDELVHEGLKGQIKLTTETGNEDRYQGLLAEDIDYTYIRLIDDNITYESLDRNSSADFAWDLESNNQGAYLLKSARNKTKCLSSPKNDTLVVEECSLAIKFKIKISKDGVMSISYDSPSEVSLNPAETDDDSQVQLDQEGSLMDDQSEDDSASSQSAGMVYNERCLLTNGSNLYFSSCNSMHKNNFVWYAHSSDDDGNFVDKAKEFYDGQFKSTIDKIGEKASEVGSGIKGFGEDTFGFFKGD